MATLTELHLHLDGSLRPQTVRELAERNGVAVPSDLLFTNGMGLADALARFAFTLSLIQQPREVRRIASEICEDAAADGVEVLEIRFAPQLHLGASIEATVDAALEGIGGRAGLILCGLYGEPLSMLERLVAIAAVRPGVVGIDLAGGPAPSHRVRLGDYAPAFARARELGIGRTVHASEGRPPEEIRIAVEKLFAQRIGHATTLLEEPAIRDLVIHRGVLIEACPTSNVHTGVIARLEDHPLPAWLSSGVRVCVCSDNTLLSNVRTSEEHRRAAMIPGMTKDLLALTMAQARAAAFPRR
jgi:adenosine deaminase